MPEQEQTAKLGREIIRTQWGLLSQWYCVPVDATTDEQAKMINDIKADMMFAGCPDEYIIDRLYGGFTCEMSERRHVFFAAGEYSFIAAHNEGRYWANSAASRQDTWERLLKDNADQAPPLDGPFTADAPRVLPADPES